MATLKFKISWFGEQGDDLEEAAGTLHDLFCKIQAISYYPEAELQSMSPAYANLRDAWLADANSIPSGRDRYREFADGIRVTGRNYARQEAANETEAKQIETWLEDAGL